MAKQLIFTNKELQFLQHLVKNNVKFMIVGLSAAALQGCPAVTQDIDLWFQNLRDPAIQKALKKVDGIYVPPTASTPPMFAGKAVALFDIVVGMHGLETFRKEYKQALDIPLGTCHVKVLSLDRIIVSKKATACQKDKMVLPVLRDTLKILHDRKTDPR